MTERGSHKGYTLGLSTLCTFLIFLDQQGIITVYDSSGNNGITLGYTGLNPNILTVIPH